MRIMDLPLARVIVAAVIAFKVFGDFFATALTLAYRSGAPVSGLPGHATLRASIELQSLLAMRQFYVQFAADDLAALLSSLDRAIALIERELAS